MKGNKTTIISVILIFLVCSISIVIFWPVVRAFPDEGTPVIHFQIDSFRVALAAYKKDIGDYPNTHEGLEALLQAPTEKVKEWKGPYITKLPLDPWGSKFQYRYPAEKNEDGYDLFSFGPDGVLSADDITNWEEHES